MTSVEVRIRVAVALQRISSLSRAIGLAKALGSRLA